jgi:hypothetical protein
MRKYGAIAMCLLFISACGSSSKEFTADEFLQAYGEVSDSVTDYILFKPSELNLTYEESLLAIDSYVARMRTAQMTFEKMTLNKAITLTDGEVAVESVNSLNRALDDFISSQERAAVELGSCGEYSDPYEAFSCVVVAQSAIAEQTNSQYQSFYQANERFKQDALD